MGDHWRIENPCIKAEAPKEPAITIEEDWNFIDYS